MRMFPDEISTTVLEHKDQDNAATVDDQGTKLSSHSVPSSRAPDVVVGHCAFTTSLNIRSLGARGGDGTTEKGTAYGVGRYFA